MTLLVTGVASAGLAGLTASAAHADTTTPTGGTVQVCKATVPGTLAVSGSFTFTISGGTPSSVTVPTGGCSNPIPVSGATATIAEVVDPAYSVTAITPEAGGTYVVTGSTNLTQAVVGSNPAQSVKVDASAGTTSTVTFTNQIDLGYVEVCKYATPGSGLSGTYSFNVSGAEGWLNGAPPVAATAAPTPPISITIPANGSGCSNPIPMPASSMLVNGKATGVAGDTPVPVTVTEAGTNLYVTSISASITNDADAALQSDNLVKGTAALAVEASATTTNDTVVNYTDDVVSFKVCKTWDAGTTPAGAESNLLNGVNTVFPFSYVVSGSAGPDAALASNSTTAGNCTADSTYRAGTQITITEGITPGSKAESITLFNPVSATLLSPTGVIETAPTAAQLLAGQITVILGTPVTAATTTPANETAVYFTDEAAAPGSLKICKIAGNSPGTPVPPAGGTFTFAYKGTAYATVASPGVVVGQAVAVSGTASVTLPLNSSGGITAGTSGCTIVTEAPVNSTTGVGTTVPFLFNSNVTVTETPSTGNAVTAIGPTNIPNVIEDLAGVPMATTEPVLTGVSLATGASTVTISENAETVLPYTDSDPPATVVPVVGPSGTVTFQVTPNTSTGSTSSVVASTPATYATTALTATTVKALTAKQKAAELKADQKLLASDTKSLANVKSAIVRENKLIAKAHGKARTADIARRNALQLEQKLLSAKISVLNKNIKLLK
jgi:hypothetical protein